MGDGLFDVEVHTFHAHGDQPTHLHFDLRFLFRATSTDLVPGSEVRDAVWVPVGEVRGDLERPLRKLSLPIL